MIQPDLDDASALLELRAPLGASIAKLIEESPMTEQLMVRRFTANHSRAEKPLA